jgi:tRNA(fMet)-specific endonuclease VapC
MYVLDTNTLIYYFKGQGQVTQHLASVLPEEIIVSTIVLFECSLECQDSRSQTGIDDRNAAAKYLR